MKAPAAADWVRPATFTIPVVNTGRKLSEIDERENRAYDYLERMAVRKAARSRRVFAYTAAGIVLAWAILRAVVR